MKNLEFIQSVNTPDKARAYVEAHIDTKARQVGQAFLPVHFYESEVGTDKNVCPTKPN